MQRVLISVLMVFAPAVKAEMNCPALGDLFKEPLQWSTDAQLIEREIRNTWDPSNFTNPHHHHGGNFLYIVRVGESEHVLDRSFISASVISQDFKGVYGGFSGTHAGKWAYILEVPRENIVVSSPSDTGALSTTATRNSASDSILQRFVSYWGLHTPQKLIEESKKLLVHDPQSYNEIFVQPKTRSNGHEASIKIVGVAYFPPRVQGANSAQVREIASHESQRLGIPMITIHP